jgi:hypothetical protein
LGPEHEERVVAGIEVFMKDPDDRGLRHGRQGKGGDTAA